LKVLEPIWQEKPETATRARGRIESVLSWATARELRKGENPARWRGHLDKLLAAKSKLARVKHHDALAYTEVPTFMADLRGRGGISARALEFTILTAARTGEAIGARWSEFDLSAKLWTVPAERMKAGKEHRAPLSDRAVEILSIFPRDGDFVFAGRKSDRPISNMAMLELVRGIRGMGATVHGFRSSFRDWAAEQTSYPTEMAEMALAHTVGDKVETAYRRGDMLEKRRRLMADWAAYCERAPAERDNVVPIREHA
jgi:integrase